ncbi:MAG TPA: PBP1A family penicillin-binding protein [Beijerinckiaceae bacterium]|jgi:1A family penicillin-binding protein
MATAGPRTTERDQEGVDPRSAAAATTAAAGLLLRQIGHLLRSLAVVTGRRFAHGGKAAARLTRTAASALRAGSLAGVARMRALGAGMGRRGTFRSDARPLSPDDVRLAAAPTARPAVARPERPRPAWRRRVARGVVGAGIVSAVALVGLLAYSLATLPLNGGLQVDPAQRALVVEAADGQTFATRGVFRGEKLASADIPDQLKQAVLAIEDRRFHDHAGIDLRGTFRALIRNAQAGGAREGGSTITQQLVRLTYLSSEKTLRRKVQEALIALWLETQLTKDEILQRYLNTAYFGAGAYGADAAAKRYFGKRAKELSLAESAMLAGLVRAPSQLAPTRNFGGAKDRADTVLQAMVETGAITQPAADAARAETVALRTPPETPPGANYFVDLVAADLKRLAPAAGDVTARTTINLELQRVAEAVVDRRLDAEGAAKAAGQASVVVLGADGAVLALVGGRDYEQSQFNRATQAKRQAGSLFKLFVYLAALQKGYTPGSVLVDRPIQIGDWEPQNASGRFRGRVELRTAFAQSINTVAVQLAEEVGIPAVIDTARRLGVQSELPAVPSLALGSAEVTLLEMTRAFGAVGSGTTALEPFTIRAIQGGTGQALYARPAPAADPSAPLGEARGPMLDMLQAVVNEGTGKAARVPGVPVGGKTGTTQEHRDAWFIGMTPELTVGVWVGNDDNAPMNRVAGGDLPAAIFHDIVARAGPLLAKRGAPTTTNARRPRPEAGATGSIPGGPARPSGLRGVPEVLDTGTLAFGGAIVRLQGVEGEDGRLARQLSRYLRGREITCEAAGGQGARCDLEGQDLATMIISAGGARTAPDASPDLLAAEEQARSARLGLWRRSR